MSWVGEDWYRHEATVWDLEANPWIRFDLSLRLDAAYRTRDAMEAVIRTADFSLFNEARAERDRADRDLEAIDREMESAKWAWLAAGGSVE